MLQRSSFKHRRALGWLASTTAGRSTLGRRRCLPSPSALLPPLLCTAALQSYGQCMLQQGYKNAIWHARMLAMAAHAGWRGESPLPAACHVCHWNAGQLMRRCRLLPARAAAAAATRVRWSSHLQPIVARRRLPALGLLLPDVGQRVGVKGLRRGMTTPGQVGWCWAGSSTHL